MNAEDILQCLRDTYATAHAYHDDGSWVMTPSELGGQETIFARFTTSYSRVRGLHFEFQTPGKDICVIRTEGERLVEFRGSLQSKEVRTLDGAVACLTGVTFGTAHTVPGLLLPSAISGRTLWDEATPKLRGVDSIDGQTCWVVDVARHGHERAIYISQSDYTLRRILFHPIVTEELVTRAKARGFNLAGYAPSSEITTYAPKIWLEGGGEP
jgi:hypothetical protein